MKEIILCKYGEIALKGLNKSSFESMMTKSVKRRLKSCGQFSVSKAQSTLYVEPLNDDSDVDMAVEKLSKIFGIVKLCRCCVLEKDMDEILTKSLDYIEDEMETARTFKVDAKRSDKKFPFKSPEICIEMGGKILERFPHLKVDVHDPDVVVTVEIRETKRLCSRRLYRGRWRNTCRLKRKGNASSLRRYRFACCRLYDGKAWCDNIRYPL